MGGHNFVLLGVQAKEGIRTLRFEVHDCTQRFGTHMKVKPCTGAVVICMHCKHTMFTYISVSHKHIAKHCIISQFHSNIKALFLRTGVTEQLQINT